MTETLSSATLAVRAGIATDTSHHAVVPPIHMSTNYTFDGLGGKREFDYSRSGNPTRSQLAAVLAELEAGSGAVVTNTGMSAVTLVMQLLQPGDKLLAPADCYGGTHRLLTALAKRGCFEVEWIDFTDLQATGNALLAGAQMVWIETPSNPLLRITDIRAVSLMARAQGATVVVDNTFLSPALQQPLKLGADIVVHSTTKYINGHSDLVGGCVIAASDDLNEQLAWWANCLGLTGSPFDAYLTMRGVRTMHARWRCHLENTSAVVELLAGHEAVARVHYPGLPDHPGHRIASRQQSGFGAMVSFELHGGVEAARGFVAELELFTLAESLGGVESLIAHPATMTHAAMDPEARARAGITDSLLRLSVGIEAPADLVADLRHAADRVILGRHGEEVSRRDRVRSSAG